MDYTELELRLAAFYATYEESALVVCERVVEPLGPSEVEKQLLFQASFEIHVRPSQVLERKTLWWMRQHCGEAVLWSLLDHLRKVAVWVREDNPTLVRLEGMWSSVRKARTEATWVDVDRLRRCLQLLGYLSFTRKEEWVWDQGLEMLGKGS